MKKEMKNKKIERLLRKSFKFYSVILCCLGLVTMLTTNVYASDDPIATVNNLSDFMFRFARVIGSLVVGYGIIQIGLSFTSHDASQRASGFLYAAGGVLIMCVKTILTIIE